MSLIVKRTVQVHCPSCKVTVPQAVPDHMHESEFRGHLDNGSVVCTNCGADSTLEGDVLLDGGPVPEC